MKDQQNTLKIPSVLAQYFTPTYFGASMRHLQGVLFAFAAIVSQCLETRQG
jgi:hypothetical protein